jgi:hypothetical protein
VQHASPQRPLRHQPGRRHARNPLEQILGSDGEVVEQGLLDIEISVVLGAVAAIVCEDEQPALGRRERRLKPSAFSSPPPAAPAVRAMRRTISFK